MIITDKQKVKEKGPNVHFRKADVGKLADVRELHRWIKENFGPPDTMVIAAGQLQEQLSLV